MLDAYAREIREIGECFLLVESAAADGRIVPVWAVRAGPDGLVVFGDPLPANVEVYRLFQPHPRYTRLPAPRPRATDEAIERWLHRDLVAIEEGDLEPV